MKRFAARAAELTQSDGADQAQLLLWNESPERSTQASEQRNSCIVQPPRRLSVGDVVAVFALGSQGPLIEGTATIVSNDASSNQYRVCFKRERIVRTRFIHPDWYADPERSLVLLREFWRSSRKDDPLIEDFFPESDA